ncbi:MAG: DUF192 domain-containing protein [Steroidobacteraceae bacterium]
MIRIALSALLTLGGLAFGGLAPLAHGQEPLADLASFPSGMVTVTSAAGRAHRFSVWIADTPARQRQGLMFVRDLPADQGMLFVNERPRPTSFWMKNTFIPLDILFFDARGKLIGAFERRTPHSLEPIGPDGPVKWVLELRAGEAARRGIGLNDSLTVIGNPEAR